MPSFDHVASALPVLLGMGFFCALMWGIALVGAIGARIPQGAVLVRGVVVRFIQFRGRRRRGRSGSLMYSPIYRVTRPNGQTIESVAASSVSKSWQSPPVGTEVPLYYSAHSATSPLGVTGLQRYLGPIILFLVGGLVGCIGLAISASIALGH